eukprot:5297901-Prymnesium_polylepis.1
MLAQSTRLTQPGAPRSGEAASSHFSPAAGARRVPRGRTRLGAVGEQVGAPIEALAREKESVLLRRV